MGIVIPLILGLLPSFAWLAFYLLEDLRHPEPKRLIFYTFLAGAFITVFVLQFQILINNWLSSANIETYSSFAFVLFALVEEFFKFFAAFLVMKKSRDLDEPIDPMIYMIVSALGFSAVENVASVFRSTDGLLGAGPIETTTLRFVGATLLHTLSSGVIGYYWGLSVARRMKFWRAIIGSLAIATLLHAIFNYFIIRFDEITIPILFLVIVGFFILSDFEKLKKLEP